MTTTTSHGQVPEALIDLIDAYAETRHRCGGIYNARTEAARKAVIEALSGVQALSAAPAVPAGWKAVPVNPTPEMWKAAKSVPDPNPPYPPHYGLVWDAMLAASPTPPAEQQATKETSGGFHVWRDISTAPKDGSRFVAIGYNYGLYSEGRHICVAQWFRGGWMETSDWNEASELQHLTHWMPLPSPPDDVAAPAEQQAAPKVAPAWEHHARKLTQWLHCMSHNDSYFGEPAGLVKQVTGELNRLIGAAPQPVAQQGAADGFFLLLPRRPKPEAPAGTAGLDWDAYSGAQMLAFGRDCSDAANAALRTQQPAPAPQPAPDCHHRPPCDECAAIAAQGGKA